MLKALLIDDEFNNLESLQFLLHHDCEDIMVVGKVQNASDAKDWLTHNMDDIVFLDINMPPTVF